MSTIGAKPSLAFALELIVKMKENSRDCRYFDKSKARDKLDCWAYV